MNDSLQAIQNAVKPLVEEQSFSLWQLVTTGGWFGNIIMLSIFALFLIAIFIFFERLFTIKKSTQTNADLVNHIRDFVHDGKLESAIDYCRRTNSPESRMIQKGLQRIGRPIGEISAAIENTGQLEVYRLEKNINTLATIAGAAPMLGFLGTVIGMIMAFHDMANVEGPVSAKLLSSGIYTAMVTTAAGLIVGIPAYIFYNLLVVKVEKAIYKMQTSVTDFLDILNKPIVK